MYDRNGNNVFDMQELALRVRGLSTDLGLVLARQKETIALAESCTGGLIAGSLTAVAGSSEYFGYGIVSYSNEAKVKLLGVKDATLDRYGAVSWQTAIEMAEGVRQLAGADYGLSVTGIAGPGGGTATKPVGLVFLGFSWAGGLLWTELRLRGTREEIRWTTVERALGFALDNLRTDGGLRAGN